MIHVREKNELVKLWIKFCKSKQNYEYCQVRYAHSLVSQCPDSDIKKLLKEKIENLIFLESRWSCYKLQISWIKYSRKY